MFIHTFVAKTSSLYFAFSPELQVVRYGSCREEALNGLQEEAGRLEAGASHRLEKDGR